MNITDYGPLKETKSHFDSDFLYNTYPCSIPLDFAEVPLHWHNEMELIYIKKGRMIVSVDLEYSVVNAGDIVVVMPGHIHSIIQNESIHANTKIFFLILICLLAGSVIMIP